MIKAVTAVSRFEDKRLLVAVPKRVPSARLMFRTGSPDAIPDDCYRFPVNGVLIDAPRARPPCTARVPQLFERDGFPPGGRGNRRLHNLTRAIALVIEPITRPLSNEANCATIFEGVVRGERRYSGNRSKCWLKVSGRGLPPPLSLSALRSAPLGVQCFLVFCGNE